ncbi:MAG: hypothetical protein RIR00_33 [Pseudomonadota bacterium]|jgi:aspartyl protease family protein
MAATLLCLCVPAAAAVEVGLAGLMSSKALLLIDGRGPISVPIGQTQDGVKLVAIQGDQAIVEIDGRKRALRVGQLAQGGGSSEGGGKVVLTADAQGHFFTTGTINGTSVRFLVDTGATMISLGASDARRIGLDLKNGTPGYSQTANGTASVLKLKLDTVRVGDITLNNVDALVHPTNDMPVTLLGMSFLNRMEMLRDGVTMTLKKRF